MAFNFFGLCSAASSFFKLPSTLQLPKNTASQSTKMLINCATLSVRKIRQNISFLLNFIKTRPFVLQLLRKRTKPEANKEQWKTAATRENKEESLVSHKCRRGDGAGSRGQTQLQMRLSFLPTVDEDTYMPTHVSLSPESAFQSHAMDCILIQIGG